MAARTENQIDYDSMMASTDAIPICFIKQVTVLYPGDQPYIISFNVLSDNETYSKGTHLRVDQFEKKYFKVELDIEKLQMVIGTWVDTYLKSLGI